MEKLTITITCTPEGKLSTQMSQPTTLEVLTQIYMTAQLDAMLRTTRSAPEQDQSNVRSAIYDMFNVAASNLLTQFAPELELRPDLTAEAIKAQEDHILTEHWATLTKEQQEHFKAQKAKLKPHKLEEK